MYKDTYLSKEGKQAYKEHAISKRKQVGIALFSALLTFGIHLVLQSLYRSVLMDTMPHIMQKSHFSSLSVYLIVIQIFYVIYFIIYYEHLTFAEILHNKWYVLVKNKFNPTQMIFSKIGYHCIDVSLIYSLGFMLTFVLCLFLKYPIVINYLLPLYLGGLLNLILIVVLTMVCSLHFKYKEDVRYILLLVAILVWSLNYALGFYSLITARATLAKGLVVFLPSSTIFPTLAIIWLVICFVLIYTKAKSLSSYTNHEVYKGDMDFSENIKIVVSENGDFSHLKKTIKNNYGKEKIADIIVNILLSLSILVFLCFNILILLISLASPEREIDVFGYIPYVFQSETMEESIMFNDLAFFHVVDKEHMVKESDIVLYKDNLEEVTVSRVMHIDNGICEVDIDHYAVPSMYGAMHDYIDIDDIYGIYSGRNRWLGALILFGNTTVGRILMLIVPIILIFYYKPILKGIRKIRE